MKLYIKYTAGCESSVEPEEEYGSWSANNYFYVDGVNTTQQEKEYRQYSDEINVCFDADIGDDIYVISVHYGSGDSFGHSSGNGEIIWAFKDSKTANNALAVCENASSTVMKFEIQDEKGNAIPVYNHDYDYFGGVETYTLNAFKLEL